MNFSSHFCVRERSTRTSFTRMKNNPYWNKYWYTYHCQCRLKQGYADNSYVQRKFGLRWRRSVVVSALASINVVN